MGKGIDALKTATTAKEVKESLKAAKILTKAEAFEQLKALEKELNKQFDVTNSIMLLGSRVGKPLPSIATGIVTLDLEVIQCGGIPRGRIIEIFGPESAGKTTVALDIIAQEQANSDNLVAFVDAEHSLDVNYAKKLGVNVDELLISQPDSGEQALETTEKLIEARLVSLIVVDSVAALVPQAELDGDMGDSHIGLQARLMSQAMRKLRGMAAQAGITVIFINQIREKVGVMFGSPEVTTGGRALKFFASVRLDVRRRNIIGSKEIPLGHELEIKAVKNKVGTPLKSTTVDLIYGVGFDKGKDYVEYAVRVGALEKAGAWIRFNGENIGNGVANTAEALKSNAPLKASINNKINELIAKNETVLSVQGTEGANGVPQV